MFDSKKRLTSYCHKCLPWKQIIPKSSLLRSNFGIPAISFSPCLKIIIYLIRLITLNLCVHSHRITNQRGRLYDMTEINKLVVSGLLNVKMQRCVYLHTTNTYRRCKYTKLSTNLGAAVGLKLMVSTSRSTFTALTSITVSGCCSRLNRPCPNLPLPPDSSALLRGLRFSTSLSTSCGPDIRPVTETK